MPPPFRRMSVAEFRTLAATRTWQSRKSEVHVHHTWRPRGSDFSGVGTIDGMYRFHTEEREFSDIAQHISIDPDGYIWSGRPWDASPASALNHNGRHVFMFETIGDFDVGKEPFAGAQKWTVFSVIDAIMDKFGLQNTAIIFHNEMSSKSCPGSSISKPVFMRELGQFRAQQRNRLAERSDKAVATLDDQPFGVIEADDLSSFDRDEGCDHLSDD